jgi:tetratricopeptide (TPR) repeat protein
MLPVTRIAAFLVLIVATVWLHAAHAAGQGADTAPAQVIGTVNFPASCNAPAQKSFNRAMDYLHSFWVKEAMAGFRTVLDQDPGCAIAYWGVAMTLQQNPLTGQEPSPQATADALAALDRAGALGAKSQRERDYLAAVALIYRGGGTTPFAERRMLYRQAMEALAQRYPDDTEASIFYALSLDMTAALTDKTFSNQLKAAAILERIFDKQPDHPGVAHYLIHSYDYPSIAKQGVPAARRYAKVAPSNPHALHMPSHIFTRLGSWSESIESNRHSSEAAKLEGNGQEQVHAMDYLVHAYLQLGQDARAKSVVAESESVKVNEQVFVGPYALAAMPARYALERRNWSDAAALSVKPGKFPFTEAITHFARGLGFSHTGDSASARRELDALLAARDALKAQNNPYWSNQVEVQRLAVEAAIDYAQGRRNEAEIALRASADLEDSMQKHIVTPSAVVPARELLGDLLLDLGKPAEALAAYEASSVREPNRLHGLRGAVTAAERAGVAESASRYRTQLAALTSQADRLHN